MLAACRALPPGLRLHEGGLRSELGDPVLQDRGHGKAFMSWAPACSSSSVPCPALAGGSGGAVTAASGLELMLSSSLWERVFGPSRRKAPVSTATCAPGCSGRSEGTPSTTWQRLHAHAPRIGWRPQDRRRGPRHSDLPKHWLRPLGPVRLQDLKPGPRHSDQEH